MSRPIHAMRALACPTFAAILKSQRAPVERLRTMAGQLDAAIMVNEWGMNQDGRAELRVFVMALELLADDLRDAAPVVARKPARRWFNWLTQARNTP